MVSTDSGRLAFQGLVLVILQELEILVVLRELDSVGFLGFWKKNKEVD